MKLKTIKIFSITCCLLFFINIIHIILYYGVNIPFWDEYDTAINIAPQFYLHNFNLYYFWLPHNVHRIVIEKFLYLLDYTIFKGNEYVLFFCQLFIQSILFFIFVFTLKKILSTSSVKFWISLIIISALLFAPQMGQIWFWSFVIQQTLTSLFFCAAIFSLKFSEENLLNDTATLLLALMCTISSFNGLIIWPALTILLFFGQAKIRRMLGFSLLGIIVILFYSYHLNVFSTECSTTLSHRIVYFFAFLGSVFSTTKVHFSEKIGIASFIAYCFFLLFINLKSSLGEKRKLLPWFGIGLLTMGSAILGAIGRVNMSVGEAISERYIPLSVPFWIGLLAITFYYFPYSKRRYKILIVITGILLAMFYFQTPISKEDGLKLQEYVSEASFAIKSDVFVVNPPLEIGYLNPQPNTSLDALENFKKYNLALFHHDISNITKQNIAELNLQMGNQVHDGSFNVSKIMDQKINPCTSGFDKGWYVSGDVVKSAKFPEIIYILDSKGSIWGAGKPQLLQNETNKISWAGFIVSKLVKPKKITLYAWVKYPGDNVLSKIQPSQTIKTGLSCKIVSNTRLIN